MPSSYILSLDNPILTIRSLSGGIKAGDGTLWSVLSVTVSGDLARKFTETYTEDLNDEKANKSPHPENFTFSKGSFNDVEFAFTLFSGCQCMGRELITGKDVWSAANAFSNLAKPVFSGSTFTGSPLCRVTIGTGGTFWYSAQGYFVSSSVSFLGAFDELGYPTIAEVSLTFRRHFGSYGRAANAQILAMKATSHAFTFSGG